MGVSSVLRARRVRALFVTGCAFASWHIISPAVHADTGTWNVDNAGNWSNTANWSGGTIADGAGFLANFTFNITANRTVTLDSARTIGGLVFTDSSTSSNDWTLSGANTLTLDGTSPVSLNVTNRTATISSVMTTADGDVVQKTGGGTLVLNAQNTIAGGFNQTAGATRINVNSTVTGGVVTSGPVGTGLLTLTGGTFQDNGTARTLQNALALAGSVTISSSGTSSLTFNSTGLTTAAGISITAANPVLTVSNTTNFDNVISSANTFTKSGAGRLNLAADNSTSWTTSAVTANGGVLGFASLLAMPNGAARPVVAAGGGTVTHTAAALSQAFVDKVDLASAGVIALDAASGDNLSFAGFTGGVRLGATGAFTYSGVLTPVNPNLFLLGGGGGTLTYAGAISGASVAVNIGRNATATSSTVVLGNAANSFEGGITIDNGILSIDTADGAAGSPSKLGAVPAAPANNITFLNGGLIRYNAGATLNVNRSIVLGSGGGGFDTNGQSISLANAISGVNPFFKTGLGTLTLSAGGAFTTTTVTGGTLQTAAAQSLSTAGMSIGNNGTTGSVVVGAGGGFTLGTGATVDLNIGSRSDGVDRPTTGTLDLSAATGTNAINVNNLRVEVDFSATSSNGVMTGSILFPTDASAVTNVTAAAAVTIANSPGEGGNATAQFNLGGGRVNISSPTMTFGGQKTSANMTSAAGATLKISNGANRTTLNIGNNNAGNTGTAPTTTMNLANATADLLLGQVIIANRTGGGAGDSTATLTISSNAGNVFDASSATQTLLIGRTDAGSAGVLSSGTMNFGGGTATIAGTSASNTPVVLGRYTGTFTGSTAGTASGTLNITGGTMTVTSAATSAIALAASDSTVTSTGAAINGTLTVNGGTLIVNKAIVHGGGATGPTYTSTVNVQAGLLDMAGNALTSLTNINFTGGTLRNAGAITRAGGLTQNGATSVFEILANNTTLTGPYTLTSGTTSISPQRTLSVSGAMNLTSAADTLLISDPTAQLTGATFTLATYGSLTGDAHYDTVKYFDGVNTLTLTDAQAQAQGNLPNNYVVQYTATELLLVQVPEPAATCLLAMTGLGLLARRRARVMAN